MSVESQLSRVREGPSKPYEPTARRNSETALQRLGGFIGTYVQPNSINNATGTTRLVTVDLIRGVAVVLMTFTHIIDDMVVLDEDFFLHKIKPYEMALISPIALVAVVFGSMKLIFGFISGMAYSVTFANRMLALDTRSCLRESARQFYMAVLALPVLYFLGLLHTYNFHAPYHFFANPAGKPFTAYTWCYCCPVFYSALTPFYSTPIIAAVSAILNMTSFKKQKKQRIAIFVYLLIGIGINWMLPLIRINVNRLVEKRYNVEFEYLDETTEFLVDHWHNLPAGASWGEIVFHLFAAHTSGQFMPVFPFLGGYVAGIGLGILVQYIKEMRIDLEGSERRALKVRTFNKLFRQYYFVCLICIIPTCWIAQQSYKRGFRHPLFWLYDYPAVFDIRMELVSLQIPFSALMVYCGLLIFELNKNYEKHARRVLFLRRFSTYSLTTYIFEGINRLIAVYPMLRRYPHLIGYHEMETFWPVFEYYARYIAVASIMCMLLDNVQGKLSVEWMLNKYACLFKPMKDKKVSDCHLNIKLMNVFD